MKLCFFKRYFLVLTAHFDVSIISTSIGTSSNVTLCRYKKSANKNTKRDLNNKTLLELKSFFYQADH